MAGDAHSTDEAAQRQALSEAAEWFAEWQAGGLAPTQRERWQAWWEASNAHRWAWQQVESVSRRFSNELGESDRQHATQVIGQARQRRRGRRQLLGGLASLAMVAVLVGILWQSTPLTQWGARWGADYRTATGEITRIVLEDGTQVWLNSASALDVDYDPERRRLVLVAGEVLVVTGEDPVRPLYLDTRSARLTPLGTRFSARERPDDELLTVFEGAVEIRTGDQAGQQQVVEAGQQASYSSAGIAPPDAAQGAREAWASGILLAENLTLSAFAEELGHHHWGRIQVDPAVADLTLLGAYPLHDLERTLRMMESALPVQAHRVVPGWIRIEAGAKASE
ncbi:FecR domain-containing protein [Halomonas salipaludis]|uniref:Protein fecR n=1 Tax=Halomonas salipaludis TaxID=2032625 RepID=A0A2A2EPC0_9GAMM|nr:FecR domain-containing protein [Halomonas salipaludis]PAU75301.1 protein fecR [Halomonas salipaludis]